MLIETKYDGVLRFNGLNIKSLLTDCQTLVQLFCKLNFQVFIDYYGFLAKFDLKQWIYLDKKEKKGCVVIL